jgi:hypothetical protein
VRFDPDQRLSQATGLGDILSAEWLNGLIEHVRRGARLIADPSTGLQVVQGTGNNTLTLAGTHGDVWSRAAFPIPAAFGAQMGKGVVRLWFVDGAGNRSDSGVDVDAYNGSVTGAVGSNRWLMVRRVAGLWVVVWEDCVPPPGDE